MKLINKVTIVSLILLSSVSFASATEPVLAKSESSSGTLSAEDTLKGVENGALCTDSKGLGYSRGAVIHEDNKIFRCVKTYGGNIKQNTKLAWVEAKIKNGELSVAD